MLSNFHSYATKTKDNNGNTIRDRSGKTEAAPLDIGSGHLNPDHAFNPGLLYGFELDDLLHFYAPSHSRPQLETLTGKPVPCSSVPVPPFFLNYPSIGIGAISGHTSIYRTVTFKGGRKDPQIFKVSVDSPPDVARGA